jgi:homoserine dehydrogenase
MLTALFWKKVWAWLKHHWYWPVIIILIIFSMATCGIGRAPQKLFGLLKKSKENHEKELQIIEETNKETNKKKTEIFAKHVEEIKKIEKEHNIKMENLEEEKQEELIKLVSGNDEDPSKLAEEVAKVLSAEFLKKER